MLSTNNGCIGELQIGNSKPVIVKELNVIVILQSLNICPSFSKQFRFFWILCQISKGCLHECQYGCSQELMSSQNH